MNDGAGNTAQHITHQRRLLVACTCLLLLSIGISVFTLHDNRRTRSLLNEERQRAQTVAEMAVLSALKDERQHAPVVSRMAAMSVVALGVRWTEDSGKHHINWQGTGFAITSTKFYASAGHVILSLIETSAGLERQGLKPTIIAVSTEGRILNVFDLRVHPTLAGMRSRETPADAIDIGLFRTTSEWRPHGLKCRNPDHAASPVVGETIAAIGFPNAVPALKYPDTDGQELFPTVKFGRVERLTERGSPTMAKRLTVQHNLPLCGGFSGSPIINLDGEVIAIATQSTHIHLEQAATSGAASAPLVRWERSRILDPAQINFGIDAALLTDWLKSQSP